MVTPTKPQWRQRPLAVHSVTYISWAPLHAPPMVGPGHRPLVDQLEGPTENVHVQSSFEDCVRAQPGGVCLPQNPGSNLGCGLTHNNQTAQTSRARGGLQSSQTLAPRDCFLKSCHVKQRKGQGKCDKNANGYT